MWKNTNRKWENPEIKEGEKMYLHIGNNSIIKTEEIIGIFNIEKLKEMETFQKFLENIPEKNKTYLQKGKEKSIIVTKEKEEVKAYISNISSTTIAKRNLK